jgi:3-hydroxyisobutyrate dehydrogenase-like beta-hydroxyacid dehydrogenase
MSKLAFLGLGAMGAPMAARLLQAGHDLAVWNRSAAKADDLVARGARRAASPAEAARGADAVLTMLSAPEALHDVVFGANGAAHGLSAGSTFIDMSTVGPHAFAALRGRLPAGVAVLDAPVLGSVPQATDGTLQVYVGGDAADFERWRGVLEALGRPRHVGPSGSGAALKLVVNSTLGTLMGAFGEALALADRLGLEQGVALDALCDSPIGVTARSKRAYVETGAYPPRFTLGLARKDLRLVVEAAASAGLALRLAPAARHWFDAAGEAGFDALDYSAVVACIRGVAARGVG